MSRIGARRRGLCVQIKCCNSAHNQVPRIAFIHLAGVESAFAGLELSITSEIDHVLLRINAEIVIGKRADNAGNWNAGKREPLGLQIMVLLVDIGLGVDAWKQRGRQAAHARAFCLFNSCAGSQHAQVGLERFLDCILQRESIGRRLLRHSGHACGQANHPNMSGNAKSLFHGFCS